MKKLFVLLIFLSIIFYKSVYCQLDPVSMVVGKYIGNFVQNYIENLYSIEVLKGKGELEGTIIVNNAYNNCKIEVNNHFEQEIKICEQKIKNAKDWYEGEFEQKCVKYETKKLEKVKLRWNNDLIELQNQRDQLLNYMMPFWKNNKTITY